MNSTKVTGRTIGEVEKLTGIPKRKLKYFIEQKLLQPSQRSESGYWLYSDEDIRKVQLVFLCQSLDCPDCAIRAILADPVRHWPGELERQIARLLDKRDRIAVQLARAEALRRSGGVWEATETYFRELSQQEAALAAK